MLKTIRLKNFKLHDDTQIDAAPITVFIGPNNSGKSSIFQALLLLRQASVRNDRVLCQAPDAHGPKEGDLYLHPPQVAVDVGTFSDIARNNQEIEIELAGRVKVKSLDGGKTESAVKMHLHVVQNELVAHAGQLDVGGLSPTWEFVKGAHLPRPTVRVENIEYTLQIVDTFRLTAAAGYQTDPQTFGFNMAPGLALHFNEVSQWIGSLPSSLLTSVHPIYALRGFEEWGYQITDYPPSTLDRMTLHDRALALTNAVASDVQLKDHLSDQLDKLLGLTIDFQTVPVKRLKIWAKESAGNGERRLLANEGTGTNQLPFIMVPVLLCPPDETILLSEPEAHLHPKAQCDLTRMLLKLAKQENIQFFLETHSEHVLHVILNAIGKGEWAPEDVAIYSFENANGAARVKRLEVDEQGGVRGGIPGFFDQSLDELTEYLETVKKPTA